MRDTTSYMMECGNDRWGICAAPLTSAPGVVALINSGAEGGPSPSISGEGLVGGPVPGL